MTPLIYTTTVSLPGHVSWPWIAGLGNSKMSVEVMLRYIYKILFYLLVKFTLLCLMSVFLYFIYSQKFSLNFSKFNMVGINLSWGGSERVVRGWKQGQGWMVSLGLCGKARKGGDQLDKWRWAISMKKCVHFSTIFQV